VEDHQLVRTAVVQPLVEAGGFPDGVEVQADGVAGRNNGAGDDVVAVHQGAGDRLGIQKLLAQQGISDSVEAKITDSLLDLQLRDSVLFESGQATLLSGGFDVLSRLIPLLQKGAFQISVEGHTDSVPISTDYYPSNWELSGARAAAVVRALIDLGIAADRLQTIGHAHTKPVADNTSEEGRKKNRRVNLILNIDAKSASHLLEQ